MPRLPDADALGGLPSGRSGRPIATYDTSAIGAGIADFGRGISQLAAGLDANRKRIEAAQTEARFQSLITQEATTWDAAQQNMPVGGTGFAEGYVKNTVNPLATAFLGPLSPELAAEYGPRLAALQRSRVTGGLSAEHAETLRYAQQVNKDNLNNNLLPRAAAVQDDAEMAALIEDAYRSIDMKPGLTPAQRDLERQDARERIQDARMNALTPEAQLEALGPVAVTPEARAFIASRGSGLDLNGVNPVFASRLQTAITAAEAATGAKATITDVSRTPERQAQYYADYTQRAVVWNGVTYQPQRQGGLAAPPGQSRHQSGQAADIARGPVLTWLHEHASEYGLGFLEGQAFRADPVHIQLAGAAAPSGASAPVFTDAIPYERRVAYAEAAQKDINDRRTVYAGGVADAAAYVAAGNPVPPEYSPEAIAANLGATPAAANAAREMWQAVEYAATADAVRFATPEEVQGVVSHTLAELNNPQSPIDYRDRAKQAQDLIEIVSDRNKALADDPAGYAQQDTNVGKAWDAYLAAATNREGDIASTARASAAYSTLALQMQDRLGVPPSEQRLLSPAAGAAIVEQFKSGGENGGQNPATFIRSLAAQWGNNWPRVFGELSDKLPGTVLVIGAMDLPEQGLAAEKLAEASMIGKSALEEQFSNENVSAVRDALPGALQDFQGTIANTVGGARTYGVFSEASKLLAYSYMREGDTPESAVNRAVQDILGRKYAFNGTFRVPREYDVDAVSRGASAALSNLDPAGLDLPQSLIGLNEDETRVAYLEALQSGGFWVTAPDETGLMLYEGTTRAAVTRNGEPVIVPWADLTRTGAVSSLLPGVAAAQGAPGRAGAALGAELGRLLGGEESGPGVVAPGPVPTPVEPGRPATRLEVTPGPATRVEPSPVPGQPVLPGGAAFPVDPTRSQAPVTETRPAGGVVLPGAPSRGQVDVTNPATTVQATANAAPVLPGRPAETVGFGPQANAGGDFAGMPVHPVWIGEEPPLLGELPDAMKTQVQAAAKEAGVSADAMVEDVWDVAQHLNGSPAWNSEKAPLLDNLDSETQAWVRKRARESGREPQAEIENIFDAWARWVYGGLLVNIVGGG